MRFVWKKEGLEERLYYGHGYIDFCAILSPEYNFYYLCRIPTRHSLQLLKKSQYKILIDIILTGLLI